jgi:hypothetical protein
MLLYKIRIRISDFWKRRYKLIILSFILLLISPIAYYLTVTVGYVELQVFRYNAEIRRFNNMSRQQMLYDFEYLMAALEENWPFFNLSVSANGVDVHALADDVRAMLNDSSTEINSPFDFTDLLRTYFFLPINQLGHLRLFYDPWSFSISRENAVQTIEQGIHNPYTLHSYEMYTRPETVQFYTRMRVERRGIPSRRPEPGPVMDFDILAEEQTALMRIGSMIGTWDDGVFWDDNPRAVNNFYMFYYEHQFYLFLKEIQHYENLIIDLRGNPGGRTAYFNLFIMPHLLKTDIHLPGYVFYMDGAYTKTSRAIYDYVLEEQFISRYDFIMHQRNNPWVLLDMTEPLPYLNTEINFADGFEIIYPINARRRYTGMVRTPGVRSPLFNDLSFDGKIWVLTDERTASAAEGITAILKYSGTATVVGESTWGILGTSHQPVGVMLSLPYTGALVRFDVAYFTDLYGRPLQGYGIQPHYANRPGMDALETVLAMIGEKTP